MFWVGLLIGGIIGYFTCALMVISRDKNDYAIMPPIQFGEDEEDDTI